MKKNICEHKRKTPVEKGIPIPKKGIINITDKFDKKKNLSGTINLWPWECMDCGEIFYFPRSFEKFYGIDDSNTSRSKNQIVKIEEDPPKS